MQNPIQMLWRPAAETDTAETEAREWAQTTQASREAQFKAIT